ncbi:Hypothetical_protein [Hexamita inflata]|uniref:Hypothetical_protein n=1 Tax=Hexamita inflata TaxID=28002 RepID=A0ABP1HAC9_9EUKA
MQHIDIKNRMNSNNEDWIQFGVMYYKEWRCYIITQIESVRILNSISCPIRLQYTLEPLSKIANVFDLSIQRILYKQYIVTKLRRHHTVNYVYTGHPFSLIITFPFLSKPMITKKHRLSVSSFGLMEFVLEIFSLGTYLIVTKYMLANCNSE